MKTRRLSSVPILAPMHFWLFLTVFVATVCWGFGLGAAAAVPADAPGGKGSPPPKLMRITPAGEDVEAGRQIVFEFDRSIVPLGRMEREASEIPIAIEPAPPCRWRWLTPSTLACQLPEKESLLPATRYDISVGPEITAEGGAGLPERVKHSFITQRPRVTTSSFRDWISPGQPQITLWFDQPVHESSVARHVFFQIAGRQRMAAVVSEDPFYRDSTTIRKGEVWLVQPEGSLPPDLSVALAIEPGILPLRGKEPSVQQQALAQFHTFPEFRMLGVECQDMKGKTFTITADVHKPTPGRCNPIQPISLLFSAPPVNEELKRRLHVTPDLAEGRDDLDPWEDIYVDTSVSQPHLKTDTYSITLPMERVKAFKEYQVEARAGSLKDVFGRGLQTTTQLRFTTDHYPPEFTLFKDMPVLEKNLDTDLPVVATNLNKLKVRYRPVFPGRRGAPATKTIQLPALPDKPVALPLGIRTMIGKPSGIVQGEVTSEPAVRREQEEGGSNTFFAQVTPFHLHVKYGHHNTLVWVTDLASGNPAPGVQVEMHEDTLARFHESPKVLASATTREDGIAMLPGTSRLDPELKLFGESESEGRQLFLWCRKGDDVAVLPFTYPFQVSSEGSNREYIPEWVRPKHGHLRAWGTTAQGIYRAGDTVQYKIYVRDQDNRRFVPPPGVSGWPQNAIGKPSSTDGGVADMTSRTGDRPTAAKASAASPPSAASRQKFPSAVQAPVVQPPPTYWLKVLDPLDKVVHERKELPLSRFGALDGSFPLPKTAAVGWYRFVLTPSFVTEELEPMRVLVSDFTPSSFKVSTELNGKVFSLGDSVTVSTQATLHAGGPYAKADTRVTALIQTQPFDPGTPQTRGFVFDVVEHTSDDVETVATQSIFQAENPLDERGTLETTFQIPDNPVIYGKLTVESAVKDDRGKRVAYRATAAYAGREQYVGLSQGDWSLEEQKPSSAQVIVVNRLGEPVPGVGVRVAVERQVTKIAQVKGVGKAYVPQYSTRWEVEENLDFISSNDAVPFTFTPSYSGIYRIRARIGNVPDLPEEGESSTEAERDGGGSAESQPGEDSGAAAQPPPSSGEVRGHQTILRRYVVGKSPVVWESLPGNVLNVAPDKTSYQTGDTARFLVQNPFPGCRALITIERFGILQSWTRTLANSTELLEIPILPDYLPGFYLSVLVVSPRVDRPMSDEGEDLGKPTFRMGYAEVAVKDSAKEIALDIQADREVYKPKETVTVQLTAKVKRLAEGENRPPVELAVAVLDEAIFALLPGRKVFDPYEGFYSLDPLDLSNYNLIMQLVGRQKLEKKGASPGGGGGPDLGMRSDFRFVAYWNPSVPTDEEGRARIQFQLPDSLTGWRILALAVTPEDRMGLGEKVFRVNQPTEVRPALPNQVVDGDTFEARFTVMNRTDQMRTLDVALEAKGPVAEPGQIESPPGARPVPAAEAGRHSVTSSLQITLAPFTRQTVAIPLRTTGHGAIELTVRAGDSMDRDAMTASLPVGRRDTPTVVAIHGMSTAPEIVEEVYFPENMKPDTGLLRLLLSPTALGGVEGSFEYMRDYPYLCWEQILTKGLMAAFFQELRPYMDQSLEWPESKELPAKTVARVAEFQASSGGMCYFMPQFEYIDPYLSAFTALGLNWLRGRGYAAPPSVEENLEKYLQSLLHQEPTSGVYTRGMNATTWAVALAALAERGKLQRHDLERFEGHVPEMSLFGKALYLGALTRVAGTERSRKEVVKAILARADHTATGVVFRESLDPRVRNLLLASTVRDNSAVLSGLLAYQSTQGAARAELGDISLRVLHSIVQGRKSKRHWRSTQENLFAVKALVDFSRAYEKNRGPVTVKAWLDSLALGSGELKAPTDPPVDLEYRTHAGDPGRKTNARVTKMGEGPLYYSLSLSYDTAVVAVGESSGSEVQKGAAPGAEGLAGLEVHREYSVEREGKWVLMKSPAEIRLGDLVRVDLFVSAAAERYFVVLEDPIPGGLEPVNRDLATASITDAEKAALELPEGSYGAQFEGLQRLSSSRWAFYHRELRHEAARFYSELLPAGRYHLTYVAQAIAPGLFTALPPRAEEMYNPEVFGKGDADSLRVGQ